MGIYIDKTKQHLKGIRFLVISYTGLFVASLFTIPIGNLYITCGFTFFAGLLNVPILPSTYSFATKLTG